MSEDAGFPSRSFVLFWRASAVSASGTYITLFALQALVVLTLHGTATEVGWLNAARWLPFLVLGVVVGAVVDRHPRRPLLVATDLVQAVLLALVPLLWWLHLLSLPALLLVVLLGGVATVVNGAAEMAFMPRLVPRPHLQRAHARVDGADAAAMTAGPALGGVLVGALGAPLAVLVDAATYLFSALTLTRVDVAEPRPTADAAPRRLWPEIREGVRWIYRDSGLTALALSTHGWFVGNAVVGVVVTPYALLQLHLTPFQLGLTGAVGGLGAVVGAAVTTRVGRLLGTGRTIIACRAGDALAVVVMATAGSSSGPWGRVVLLALGTGIFGVGIGASNSHEMSYRQLVTPDSLQARTNTTMRSLNRAVMVVVAPVAGVVADAWGLRATLLTAALVFAVGAAGLALTPFRAARAPA
ncbi:MFS transporter [Angustibacter peucedani]